MMWFSLFVFFLLSVPGGKGGRFSQEQRGNIPCLSSSRERERVKESESEKEKRWQGQSWMNGAERRMRGWDLH